MDFFPARGGKKGKKWRFAMRGESRRHHEKTAQAEKAIKCKGLRDFGWEVGRLV